MRLRRCESFPGALRMRLLAMCLSVTKFSGALSVLSEAELYVLRARLKRMTAAWDDEFLASLVAA